MSPFKPRGETAQWRTAYRVLQAAPIGETVTYATLAAALNVDPVIDRHRIQAACRKAAAHSLSTDDRAVEVVPNAGYRVVDAERHVPLASAQVERAMRNMDKGRDLTVHIRMDELSPESAAIVKAMALGFAQVAEYARQMTRRVEDHEGRLGDIEAELARMRGDRRP